MQTKRTYRLDRLTDQKIKLLKDIKKLPTEGAVIDWLVGKYKI